MPVPNYLLSESAAGYSLYEVTQSEEIGSRTQEFLKLLNDGQAFRRLVKLVSFVPFKNAAHALENINDISEGQVHDHLKAFLELNLPKGGKVTLGVSDPKLAGSIKDILGKKYDFDTSDITQDLLRGIHLHETKLLKNLQPGDLEKAQLGLGHSYSRAKVKFNVNKSDNMIIQTIALLDQLDKDINTFAMRVREWYSWHFPELVRHIAENYRYAQLALLIKDKAQLTESSLQAIASIVEDNEDLAQSIIDSAKMSMGQDLSAVDMENVVTFAEKVIKLADFRKELHAYLVEKMNLVAPNLSTLIGEMVGARLIAHAGSLINLSKYPASTVQILGAEKALFRALKTKGNTPKYGLIYHSSFIGRAGARNKGRISRFLANKCSIAARIDSFSDAPTTVFGEALKKQVEERLAFYETGVPPTKNVDAMKEALAKYGELAELIDLDEDDEDEEDEEEEKPKTEKKSKKEKKEKKDKKVKKEKKDKKKKAAAEEAETMQLDGDAKREEKKKKRKRDEDDEGTSKKAKKEKKEKKKKSKE